MEALTLLRRLAEHHDYSALREACLDVDSRDPGVRVLLALADVHLGDTSAGRRAVASLDRGALSLDARVDLAAVYIALGELDPAIDILEAEQRGERRPRAAAGPSGLVSAAAGKSRSGPGVVSAEPDAFGRSSRCTTTCCELYRDSGRLTDMVACLDAAWEFWDEEQAQLARRSASDPPPAAAGYATRSMARAGRVSRRPKPGSSSNADS